jgi:predicted nucleotidyltransferase
MNVLGSFIKEGKRFENMLYIHVYGTMNNLRQYVKQNKIWLSCKS